MSWLYSERLRYEIEKTQIGKRKEKGCARTLYMSLPSSQVLVEESLGASCSDGEPSVQLSVISTQHPFWHRDKTTDASRLSKFGLTYQHFQYTHPSAKKLLNASVKYLRSLSSLEDSHARTSQPPGKGRASTATAADYGLSSHESLARYDRQTSSWKTAQCSLLGDLEKFSETWPRWGIMLDGVCWAQTMLEHRTCEKESGFAQSWPTVSCSDATRGGRQTANMTGVSLAQAMKSAWSTPTTMDTLPQKSPEALQREMTIARPGRTAYSNLRDQVPDHWATPALRDHKGPNSEKHVTETGTGRMHMDQLANQAAHLWPTVVTGDAYHRGSTKNQKKLGSEVIKFFPNQRDSKGHPALPGATPCSSSAETESKGQLNPDFVEWLMGWPIGWPIGWTELEPLATAKFQQWQQQHGGC